MAKLRSCNYLVLASIVVAGVIMYGGNKNNVVTGQTGGCQGDMQGLITQCAIYVQRGTPPVDPSQACCNVIKTVDIPCVCKQLTKQIEQIIDMNKVFHMASFCGRPLPSGTKCGSK